MRSGLTKHFALEVSKVEAFYEPAFDSKIIKLFPNRPVMFEALKDYSRATPDDYKTNEEFFERMSSNSNHENLIVGSPTEAAVNPGM